MGLSTALRAVQGQMGHGWVGSKGSAGHTVQLQDCGQTLTVSPLVHLTLHQWKDTLEGWTQRVKSLWPSQLRETLEGVRKLLVSVLCAGLGVG